MKSQAESPEIEEGRAWLEELLDETSVLALKVWTPVQQQVQPLHSQITVKDRTEKVPYVIRETAVFESMRWAQVPESLKSEVWTRVQILHDVKYHRGHNYDKTYCYHGELIPDFLELSDRCEACWKLINECATCKKRGHTFRKCPKG